MGATSGSVYQATLVKHIANTPPNAYPRTSFETPSQYFIRMASQGLPPDIGPTESDSEYLTRLATYVQVPPVQSITAVYATSAGSATTATSATSAATAVSASYAVSASFAP
jgi:hypothetical protein